jgi:hypothetical protein
MTLSTTILSLFAAATAPAATVSTSVVTAPPAARAAAPAKSASRIEDLRTLVYSLASNDTDVVSALRASIAR